MDFVIGVHDSSGRIISCTPTEHLSIPRITPEAIVGQYPWEVVPEHADTIKTKFARCIAFGEQVAWTMVLDGATICATLSPLVGGGAISILRRLPAVDELSARVREICWHLSHGKCVREICEQLDLSQSTVYAHAKNAMDNLGLPDINSLTAYAARNCQAFCPQLHETGACLTCRTEGCSFDA